MDLLFLSKRIYLGTDEGFIHGGIIVDTEGIIRKVMRSSQEVNTYLYSNESEAVYDFENMVLMPGLIDSNVHINEPGRKDWEGFATATKAAAAGGFTVIVDRPTNASPATTNVAALKAKTSTARGKIYVDVGFWGGLVPNNLMALEELAAAGVMGIQCSLCPTSEPVSEEFPPVSRAQVEEALKYLDDGSVLAFHAELPLLEPMERNMEKATKYESYAVTRPLSMEVEAVRLVTDLAVRNKKKHFHLLNVSSAEVLPLIAACKRQGGLLTAETCPHYLSLAAEDIEDCRTEFKTTPPIRGKENQEPLWSALKNGVLDMITSDHSPATPGAKCLTYGKTRGNFLNAWPGVSSLQLGFSIVWTHCEQHGLGLQHIHRLMCQEPVALCGLENFKGKIEEGFDADFCIWDPEEEFTVTPDMLLSSNKATPYMNQRLRGVVHATIVRGLHVFQKYESFGQPLGKVILRKSSKKVVKFVRL